MDNNNNKTLNKDNFNNMSIPEQIQIVNKFIKLGDSINNIAKMLGYNETTLRDRYKRAGYARVSKRGIFVPIEELEQARAEEANNKANKSHKSNKEQSHKEPSIKTSNKKIKEEKGAIKKMKSDNKNANSNNIEGQENLLNTIELGDNKFKLLPAKKGEFSTALELNNAVKDNINIRTNKEITIMLLSLYNFLSDVDNNTDIKVTYTTIFTAGLSMYFKDVQNKHGDRFNDYILKACEEIKPKASDEAIMDLIKLINNM